MDPLISELHGRLSQTCGSLDNDDIDDDNDDVNGNTNDDDNDDVNDNTNDDDNDDVNDNTNEDDNDDVDDNTNDDDNDDVNGNTNDDDNDDVNDNTNDDDNDDVNDNTNDDDNDDVNDNTNDDDDDKQSIVSLRLEETAKRLRENRKRKIEKWEETTNEFDLFLSAAERDIRSSDSIGDDLPTVKKQNEEFKVTMMLASHWSFPMMTSRLFRSRCIMVLIKNIEIVNLYKNYGGRSFLA